MSEVIIRDARESDYAAIVDLNTSEVQHTSAMDINRVRYLDSISAYQRVAILNNQAAAFLLAMKDHTPYKNDNFGWFSSRYEKFLYIDRIVVGRPFQGCKIGTLLYRDIFDYARKATIPVIACEVNLVPPNESSLTFHARFNFIEIGSQWVADGQKQVSMQVAAP